MTYNRPRSIMILTTQIREPVINRVSTTGYELIHKRLDSSPENWLQIAEEFKVNDIRAVIVVVNKNTYKNLSDYMYIRESEVLLPKIASVPNLVMSYEKLHKGTEDDKYDLFLGTKDDNYSPLPGVTAGQRKRALSLLERYGLQVFPYKTNAELSELSIFFIEDLLTDLVFRVYIPNGQLFQNESDQLLTLFHDWLSGVRNVRLRKQGYKTSKGQVIEFFATSEQESGFWTDEVTKFNDFLNVLPDNQAAETKLVQFGISPGAAQGLVASYQKRARRIQIDAKQERDERIFRLRQELESNMAETLVSIPLEEVTVLTDQIIPTSPQIGKQIDIREPKTERAVNININQQFIHEARGFIANSIVGDVHIGPQGEEIAKILETFGGHTREDVVPLLVELQDHEARREDRLRAGQKLRKFLGQIGSHAQQAAVDVLTTWIKKEMGL